MSDNIGYLRFVASDDADKNGPLYSGYLNDQYAYFRPKLNALAIYHDGQDKAPKQYTTQREDKTSYTLRSPKKLEMSMLYYRERAGDGDNFAVRAGILAKFIRPVPTI